MRVPRAIEMGLMPVQGDTKLVFRLLLISCRYSATPVYAVYSEVFPKTRNGPQGQESP